MVSFGSYGIGGSSSSSKLSPLAPPFTYDRSIPKPISGPLLDLIDPSVPPPNSSSLHGWPHTSRPSNSELDLFSNPNPEFSEPHSTKSDRPNTHLPPLDHQFSSASSIDAFSYSYCSDSLKTSVKEPKPFYPSNVSSFVMHKDGSLLGLDQPNYDWGSTLDGSFCKESLGSEHRTMNWECWDGLTGWENGDDQVGLGRSYGVKEMGLAGSSIYDNYLERGTRASKSLQAGEEASHIITGLGWNKPIGLTREQLDDKLFLETSPQLLPSDYSRTSNLNLKFQSPNNSPYGKQLRQNDARLGQTISIEKLDPSSAIGSLSFFSTSSSGLKIGPSKSSNTGNVAGETSTEKRNDPKPIVFESLLKTNEELKRDNSVAKDGLDYIFEKEGGYDVPNLSTDSNAVLNTTETANGENISDNLDQYNSSVDSPCWKGASSFTHFSPFGASDVVPHHLKKLEPFDTLNLQAAQVIPLNKDANATVSAIGPSVNTIDKGPEKGLATSPKIPPFASPVLTEHEDDSMNVGKRSHSKMSCGYNGSQYSYDIRELMEGITEKCNNKDGKLLSTIGKASTSNMSYFSGGGSYQISFDATEHVLRSPSGEDPGPAKLSETCSGELTPKLDVQVVVDTMHNLSELLLFHCSNGFGKLQKKDLKSLESVVNNLDKCIAKSVEQINPTQESLYPQQSTSQSVQPQTMPHRSVKVDHSKATTLAAVNVQNLLYEQSDDGEKNTTSVSTRVNADLMREEAMIQALKKVFNENSPSDEEEPHNRQTLFYKNLWYEAEAALCYINFRDRFNRVKHEIDKTKENTTSEDELSGSDVSFDLTKYKLGPEILCGPHASCHSDDIMPRFQMLKSLGGDSNAMNTAEESAPEKRHLWTSDEARYQTLKRRGDNVENLSTSKPSTSHEKTVVELEQNGKMIHNHPEGDLETSVLARLYILQRRGDMGLEWQQRGENESDPLMFTDRWKEQVNQSAYGNEANIKEVNSTQIEDNNLAGKYDNSSSDWEHVMKEELVGQSS